MCGCGAYTLRETRRIHFRPENGETSVEVVEWDPDEDPERLLDRMQWIAEHLGAPGGAIYLPDSGRVELTKETIQQALEDGLLEDGQPVVLGRSQARKAPERLRAPLQDVAGDPPGARPNLGPTAPPQGSADAVGPPALAKHRHCDVPEPPVVQTLDAGLPAVAAARALELPAPYDPAAPPRPPPGGYYLERPGVLALCWT